MNKELSSIRSALAFMMYILKVISDCADMQRYSADFQRYGWNGLSFYELLDNLARDNGSLRSLNLTLTYCKSKLLNVLNLIAHLNHLPNYQD